MSTDAADLAHHLSANDHVYAERAAASMEIVPAENMAALETLDQASRELAVTQYLEHARTQLALAVEATGPAAVAALKAEIATAAEATRQLGLSKEIQIDAQEMVRRAEFAVRRAVTAAQVAGEVRTKEDNLTPGRSRSEPATTSITTPIARSYFSSEAEYRDANVMARLPEDEFDEILAEAKTEGDLSRANVVRKVKDALGSAATPRRVNRKPLPDMAKNAGWELRKSMERVERLFDDDRYRTNEKQVADALRGHLLYVAETVAAVLDQLP